VQKIFSLVLILLLVSCASNNNSYSSQADNSSQRLRAYISEYFSCVDKAFTENSRRQQLCAEYLIGGASHIEQQDNPKVKLTLEFAENMFKLFQRLYTSQSALKFNNYEEFQIAYNSLLQNFKNKMAMFDDDEKAEYQNTILANRQSQCRFIQAQEYARPSLGGFFESMNRANSAYDNCMAGIPQINSTCTKDALGNINCTSR